MINTIPSTSLSSIIGKALIFPGSVKAETDPDEEMVYLQNLYTIIKGTPWIFGP